jgi:hypothetical protein
MERFTLKISANKKLTTEQLFTHEQKGFHPEAEDTSALLDGISLNELINEYDLLSLLNVKLIDTHLGLEWELSGFGWNLINGE